MWELLFFLFLAHTRTIVVPPAQGISPPHAHTVSLSSDIQPENSPYHLITFSPCPFVLSGAYIPILVSRRNLTLTYLSNPCSSSSSLHQIISAYISPCHLKHHPPGTHQLPIGFVGIAEKGLWPSNSTSIVFSVSGKRTATLTMILLPLHRSAKSKKTRLRPRLFFRTRGKITRGRCGMD